MRDDIEQLLAKQALHELSAKYACAVDRLDYKLMASLWWPEATVDVGVFKGDAAEYSRVITTPNTDLLVSHHAVSNALYEIDGSSACGQVYVNAATIMRVPDSNGQAQAESLVGGRYVDRYERRDDEWKFLFRGFVIDWAFQADTDTPWMQGFMDIFPHRGQAGSEDFSYQFLNKP